MNVLQVQLDRLASSLGPRRTVRLISWAMLVLWILAAHWSLDWYPVAGVGLLLVWMVGGFLLVHMTRCPRCKTSVQPDESNRTARAWRRWNWLGYRFHTNGVGLVGARCPVCDLDWRVPYRLRDTTAESSGDVSAS